MGAGMAANLVGRGADLAVFDIDRGRAVEGARRAGSLTEIAEAGDVILSLPGPPEVREVGLYLAESMPAGTALISVSTVSVEVVQELEAAARPRGVSVVDAPVTGAADGARAGTLTIMAGADPSALERVRPLLEAVSSAIVHTGPVGTGSAAKLLTNMLWFVHVVALSDALALGVKAGIAPETLGRLIPASAGGSWVADHDLPNVLAGDDDVSFTLALCCKDLRLIAGLADGLGVQAPLGALARERFEAALERFGLGAGELAVVRLAEDAAGVSVRS
jgi:3-hydroxyisobutyrate dehydrogenase-like beta-hydroxyacid dehydrogenase